METHHHLHARIKKEYSDDMDIIFPSSAHSASSFRNGQEGSTHNNAKKEKGHWGNTEPKWAVIVAIRFALVGLLLGFFLLHSQHRKEIIHFIHDPVKYVKGILRGRVDFRHHFSSGSPRFVTVVMPSVVKPTGRTARLKTIQETWGPNARSLYVVHNVSEFPDAAHLILSEEEGSPSDHPDPYPQLLLTPSNIGGSDILRHLHHTIRVVYDRINPDFVFFVNNHTCVIPEHLCKYLEHRHSDHDLYAGHDLTNGRRDIFNAGAAEYVLSRSSMRKIVEQWDEQQDDSTACSLQRRRPGAANAQCLHSLGIDPINTRAEHRWHRFHAFPLTRVVAGVVNEWYMNMHSNFESDTLDRFDESYRKMEFGEDCCSMDIDVDPAV